MTQTTHTICEQTMTHYFPTQKLMTWLLIILINSILSVSVAQTAIPPLNNGVMDSANVLKASEKAKLDEKIMQFERESGSQIAVLIIPQLNNEDIVDYGVRVMEKWKLGRKDIDDGVLLIISVNDRKTRLEVGYGLEGAIPDITAAKILNEYLAPHFKNQNYYQGINQATYAIIALIQVELLTQNFKEEEEVITEYVHTKSNFGFIFFITIALILLYYLYRLKPKATFLLSMSAAILAIFISHVYIGVLPASIVIGVCVFMFVSLIHMLIHHPEKVSFSSTKTDNSNHHDRSPHISRSETTNTNSSQSYTSSAPNSNDRHGRGGKSGGGGATGGW